MWQEVDDTEWEGIFTYVNEQACRSLGYTREELMGMHLWDIDPGFKCEFWDTAWEQLAEINIFTHESTHRRKDGTTFPIEVSAKLIKITPEERSTAVRSANIMGLNVAGVDLLRSNHGPVVMEVNSSPGLEGIEGATGKDVANMVIEFIEKNAKPGRTRSRGKG